MTIFISWVIGIYLGMDYIYFRTLEIGLENQHQGIAYNKIVAKIKKEGKPIPGDMFEQSYINWFYNNFFQEDVNRHVNKFGSTAIVGLAVFKDFNDKTAHIAAKGIFAYYEYKELKEAREASESSMTKAIESIGVAKKAFYISIIALTASIGISLYSSLSESDMTNKQIQQWEQEKIMSDDLYKVLEEQGTLLQNSLPELAKDTTLRRLIIQSNPE